MTPVSGDPAWAERYEQLRAHATGHAPQDFIPRGLALLRQRGIVAWMTAAGSSDDGGRRGAGPPRDRPGDGLDPRRRELVRLLANVAFPLAVGSRP